MPLPSNLQVRCRSLFHKSVSIEELWAGHRSSCPAMPVSTKDSSAFKNRSQPQGRDGHLASDITEFSLHQQGHTFISKIQVSVLKSADEHQDPYPGHRSSLS